VHRARRVNPQAEELKQRTKRFALSVLAFVRTLPASDEARDVGGQLRRAGTGAASNYRATCRSRSDAEFVARIGNALEEADESGFWLEVIVEGKISTGKRALELLDEANQLSAIFAQSKITATERLSASGKSMPKASAEIEKLKTEVANLKSLVNQKT
jgi:four helix bundle protein